MVNNILDSLAEFKEKGIIDEKQLEDMKFEIHKSEALSRRRILKLANLTLALTVILMISISVLTAFNEPFLLESRVKIFSSLIFMSGSIFLLYGAIVRKEYFMQELFVMFNVFATICLLTSMNQLLEFRYKVPENLVFTMFAVLPVFALTETYITLFAISVMFVFGESTFLNLSVLPVSNDFYMMILCSSYIIMLGFKYIMTIKQADMEICQSEYISNRAQRIIIEVLMTLYFLKIVSTSTNGINPIFIYIIFTVLLFRRSSYFEKIKYFPDVIDNVLFIALSLIYIEVNPTESGILFILSYHIIYYLIYFLLNERGVLETIPKTYIVRQQFYLNLIFIVYLIIPLEIIRENWYILTMTIGLFNVYIAKKTRSVVNIFLGFGLIAFTIIETGIRNLTLESSVNLMVLGLCVIIGNFNNFRQGVRGIGTEEES